MLGYDDTGDGEPLVLIHGWAARRSIWRHVIPLLGGRRIIAIDVPGFGDSPPAGPGFDLDDVARAIWDGLPTDGPVTIVGHSLGGAVALTAAALEPERTRALVLCAPAGLRPLPARISPVLGAVGGRVIHLRRRATPLAATSLGRRLLMGANTAGGDAISQDDVVRMVMASDGAARLGASLRTVTSVDLRPLLHQAPAQLGALWGAHDRVVPTAIAEVVRMERPDAQVEIVPGTGHVPMMEQPAAFAAALSRLLIAEPGDVHTMATNLP